MIEKIKELEKKGFHRRAVTLLKDHLLTIGGEPSNGYFDNAHDIRRSDVVRRIRKNSRAKLRQVDERNTILNTSDYTASGVDYD